LVDPTEHFAANSGLGEYYSPSVVKSILFSDFTDDATMLIEWLNSPELAHLSFLDVILEMAPEYSGEINPAYADKFDIENGNFVLYPYEKGDKVYFPKLILERTHSDSPNDDPERIFVYEDNLVAIVDDASYKLYELD
jgi:hypothetical protein